jgi:hypothetical protein
MGVALGFLLGIAASAIAALVYEYGTRPKLKTVLDDSGRAQGQAPGNPPHEFYHLSVRNLPPMWPLPGRRPGWACRATLEVFNQDGSRAIPDAVPARWTSQPEPLLPAITGGQVGNLLDPARLVTARRVDVHEHEAQPLAIAVKFEGADDLHVFTNESYVFPRWQNPAWRLPRGTYRLLVTVYYERGRRQDVFELNNAGPRRDDVTVRASF